MLWTFLDKQQIFAIIYQSRTTNLHYFLKLINFCSKKVKIYASSIILHIKLCPFLKLLDYKYISITKFDYIFRNEIFQNVDFPRKGTKSVLIGSSVLRFTKKKGIVRSVLQKHMSINILKIILSKLSSS